MADTDAQIPPEAQALVGVPQHAEASSFAIEMGYVYNTCAAVQNGNPLFWDEAAAREITHGWIAPPTMMSVWFRPHYWVPGAAGEKPALQLHFDLKHLFDMPEAIVAGHETVFGVPVRPGDRLRAHQVLRTVSAVKTTRVGTGRFWVIDLECFNQHDDFVGRESYDCFGYRRSSAAQAPAAPLAGPSPADPASADAEAGPDSGATRPGASLVFCQTREGDQLPRLAHRVTATTVVLGALASRDWRPMHHDRDFAINRNGVKDIFMNAPNNAAWFERYVTDWTGPKGRLGRMKFRMIEPVFPGDEMVLSGRVMRASVDETGCGWVELDLAVSVEGRARTSCRARVALPRDAADNPWERKDERWKP